MTVCVLPQPIRMQTTASKVELAVMHVMESEAGFADLGAMCNKNPLHSFMFDAQGKLLNANRAAFEAFQSSPPGTGLHPFLSKVHVHVVHMASDPLHGM